MEVALFYLGLPFISLQSITPQMTLVMTLSPGSQDLALILS